MNIEYLLQKDEVLTVVNKLFVYTDERNWDGLLDEVFTAEVNFDMGQPSVLAATAITAMWDEGLKALEAIHHQTGNYTVTINGNQAEVNCYGTAWHYRQHPSGRNTRVFVGSYTLKLEKGTAGWRINTFIFHKKFIDGNLELA